MEIGSVISRSNSYVLLQAHLGSKNKQANWLPNALVMQYFPTLSMGLCYLASTVHLTWQWRRCRLEFVPPLICTKFNCAWYFRYCYTARQMRLLS